MNKITQDEYRLLTTLQPIINESGINPSHQDVYISMVHQIYSILGEKYKFDLRKHYIGGDGFIFDRTQDDLV